MVDLSGWVVFLDRNLLLGGQILSNIGDSKAALAERRADYIFPFQGHAWTQGMGLRWTAPWIVEAMATGILRSVFRIFEAACEFHAWFPPFI